jgi:hypothetical protein
VENRESRGFVHFDIESVETPIGVASKGGKAKATKEVVIWLGLSLEG